MKIISTSFINNKKMNAKHSYIGGNVSPHLSWSDFPSETKSFVLLVHDPDAPIASGFWHWQLLNINSTTTELEEGLTDETPFFSKDNDSDTSGYYGPQPPKGHGVHRYNFVIYAMPFKDIVTAMKSKGMTVTKTSSKAMLAAFIGRTAIDSAVITGLFETK